MPYTIKEKKLYRSLKKQYGARAEEVYHRMLNSRKHEKVFGARSKKERAAKRKRGRKRRKK